MVNRVLEYPIEVPWCEDDLRANKNFMIGLGKLAETLIGKNTVIQGLPCTPTTPASLEVLVGAGQIFSWQNVDDTDYSELPLDTAHQIVKQGLVLDETTLSCPAPGTPGFSINYLVQITFQEVDALNEERAFYNSADPSEPFYVYTDSERQARCIVAVKAGTEATTGTQVTPDPDVGYVGAWVVTVDNGQTEITAGDITEYPEAPFFNLTNTIYYAVVKNDGSNNYSGPSKPPISAYLDGTTVVISPDANNTDDCTLDVGHGAVQILDLDGAALQADEIKAETPYIVIYKGGKWIIQVTSKTTINQFAAEHISGFHVSNDAGDTAHDILFGEGECRDTDDTMNIKAPIGMVKQIDVPWAPGTGQGGFPTGLTLGQGWYELFVIAKLDGTYDFGYDSNPDANQLLADASGFTGYRRVMSVHVNASLEIDEFKQSRDDLSKIMWKTPKVCWNGTNPTTTPTTIESWTPPGRESVANLAFEMFCPTVVESAINIFNPEITGGPYLAAKGFALTTASGERCDAHGTCDVLSDSNGQMLYQVSATKTDLALTIWSRGWIETRKPVPLP